MNIGFYVSSLKDEKEVEFASRVASEALETQAFDDASIFYDGIGFVPYFIECGLFNSTDLWNFSGSLLVMNIDCLKKAIKIVNKIKLFYYYGWDNVDVFNLLLVRSKNIPIICKTQEDNKKIYRLTGKYADLIVSDKSSVIEFLKVRYE